MSILLRLASILIVGILAVFFFLYWPEIQKKPAPQDEVSITPSQATTSPVFPASGASSQSSTKMSIKIALIALEGKGGIGCGDAVQFITAEANIPPTKEVLRAALNDLFSLKLQRYGQSGLYNALYQSDLRVDSITTKGAEATVYLTGALKLGGVCDNPRVKAQIEQTALQFPTIHKVAIFINSKPIDEALSLK